VVLRSYDAGGSIQPGNSFTLSVTLANVGAGPANNMMVTFSSSDFLPTSNGGVQAVSSLKGGKSVELSQPMLASENLAGQSVASLTVKVDYTDSAGTARSDSFVITINLAAPSYVSSGPLPTATPMARPQLVISTYKTSVEPLQPGTIFNLKIDLKNLGSADARAVTMVLGGGGSTAGADGTPQAGGGISGSGGDLTNFAPLGSSNLVYLGDVPTGGTLSANPQLIVNVTTNPSAYPLKISFVYTDSKGNRQVDDQVITLLVYSLPQVEVSFYRDAGPFSVGQPAPLPLQVTNLGRKTAVLGNMHVSSDNGDVTNNVSLVGVLDPGGYYTLDANLLPAQAGPAHIKIIINYTDDFNQPRTVEQEITVNVDEAQVMPTPMSGGGGPGDAALQQPETAGHWFVRLLKGLFGLDNALPGTATPTPENTTPVHMPGGKGG
jgi:hypothetical protein